MPIYEYRCLECGTKSTFVTLVKLVSRVGILQSEENRLGSLADPSKLAGVDEHDPKSLARWMKRMGKEMGDEMGEDFDQSIDEVLEQSEEGEPDEGGGGAGGGNEEL
jgi:hypothetical protein